jgi:hypothetical protein
MKRRSKCLNSLIAGSACLHRDNTFRDKDRPTHLTQSALVTRLLRAAPSAAAPAPQNP